MNGTAETSSSSEGHDSDWYTTEFPEGVVEKTIEHSPYLPYDANVGLYSVQHGVAMPYQFTDWQEEAMAWKESCYLHAGLNPSPTYKITGPGALDFLAAHCTNSFAKFPVGRGKHALMCRDDGLLLMHGVLLRLGEEEFITYWLSPNIQERLEEGGYDAVGEDLTGKVYMFQVAGPRSLEVLEAASGDDLHDIKFMAHRPTSIDGHEVTVLRMGMGGTLSYELHGPIEDAKAVYKALQKAGEPFNIRQMGWGSFMLNHTENGFHQAWWHFLAPTDDAPSGDAEASADDTDAWSGAPFKLYGSLGPDISKRWCTPIDLGWNKMVAFDHEFRGRAALEKQVADPKRTTVTLVWNAEDILDVHASQLRAGEPYKRMDSPYDIGFFIEGASHFADQVLKDGKEIGFSAGRTYSHFSREMLSLAVIDVEYAEPGTELTIVWGEPGTKQKQIRAITAPVPYLKMTANRDFDVESIPRLKQTV